MVGMLFPLQPTAIITTWTVQTSIAQPSWTLSKVILHSKINSRNPIFVRVPYLVKLSQLMAELLRWKFSVWPLRPWTFGHCDLELLATATLNFWHRWWMCQISQKKHSYISRNHKEWTNVQTNSLVITITPGRGQNGQFGSYLSRYYTEFGSEFHCFVSIYIFHMHFITECFIQLCIIQNYEKCNKKYATTESQEKIHLACTTGQKTLCL